MTNDPVALIFKEVGEEPFYKLVDEFYAGVENDFVLRPLYPEDLSLPKQHLALFLIQRTGGPTTYSDQRGHPRMRARHMPFPIGVIEKNAWMHNMTVALDKVPELEEHKEVLKQFFENFATFLINKSD